MELKPIEVKIIPGQRSSQLVVSGPLELFNHAQLLKYAGTKEQTRQRVSQALHTALGDVTHRFILHILGHQQPTDKAADLEKFNKWHGRVKGILRSTVSNIARLHEIDDTELLKTIDELHSLGVDLNHLSRTKEAIHTINSSSTLLKRLREADENFEDRSSIEGAEAPQDFIFSTPVNKTQADKFRKNLLKELHRLGFYVKVD